MIVDRRLRSSALIRVLRVVAAADSPAVHSEDLEREWRRMTGLRQADLDLAVRDMVDRGHLNVQRVSGTRRDYELTTSGRGELLWQGALLNTGDWFVLLGARMRGWLDVSRRRTARQPAVERRQRGNGVSVT